MLEDWGTPRLRRQSRRGRRRFLLLAGVVGAAATSLLLVTHGGASTGSAHITIHRGDTLWAIAASRYSGDDIQTRVQQIEAANHLAGGRLSPGQILTLPEP